MIVRPLARSFAIVALLALAALSGCNKHGGPLSPGSSGGRVGYVDLDKVVEAHPLRVELDSLQNQITLLTAQAQHAPQVRTSAQAQAQAGMEADLAAAEQQFQQEIANRRAFYEQREAAAVSALQGQTSGGTTSIGQQYGQQVQRIQGDAMKAYGEYQKQLFAADSAHLREVSRQLQQEAGLKIEARRKQLEKQETDYQITLAKQSQTQRLNLKAKLEDLSLTPEERTQYTSQLQNIATREEAMINQLKSRDNADLKTYEDAVQRDAAARFNAARTLAMSETQTKLQARQKQTNDQLRTQLSGIGTQYQKSVTDANAALQKDPKLRAQAAKIHSESQAQYSAEFAKALTAYERARKDLVAKYSAIAGMKFQDNAELDAAAQQIAAQRRDLYGKIVAQVQAQVSSIASQSGIAVVFTSVRGAGAAVDLTDQVTKAIAALPAAVPSPSSSTGSK